MPVGRVRPRILPGNGIAIAELGQHTASGIVLIGVAQAPATPLLSLTPVKNSPITARSTAICARSAPRIASIADSVSAKIESVSVSFISPRLSVEFRLHYV